MTEFLEAMDAAFELLRVFFHHMVHSTECLPNSQAVFQPALFQATRNLQAS